MDALQIHLLLNHVPIIGALVALLVVVVGHFAHNKAIGITGLAMYFVMALAVVPTYLSGEPAEERIENIAGIQKSVIEAHEDMATISLWIMLAAAAFAGASFYAQWKSMSSAKLLSTVFIVVAIGAFIHIGLTGHEGGKIRRPDLGTNE